MQNPDQSGNFPSTTASNFWVFPPKPGDVDCRLFATCRLLLRTQGGEVVTITIRTGGGACSTLTALQTSPGVLRLMPVLLTCRGVLLTHTPSHASFTTTSFVSGVNSVCGAATIGTILGSILRFIFGAMTGRVRLLNNFLQNSRC